MRFRLVHYVIIAVLVFASSLALAAPPEKMFDEGIAASRQGNYQQAIRHFRRAREQGMDKPDLYFNLGVAYYRTGRYGDARASFERAAEAERLRALSHYNLGLVAEAADNEDTADAWFRKAYEQASTAKLRRLAADKLAIAPRAVAPYTLYAELFGGHDSNPRLTEADTAPGSGNDREGDAVYGALAVGRYLVSGNWSNGFALYGNAYTSRYPDLGEEDLDSLTAGGAAYNRVGEWQQRYRLVVNHLRLGGETLTESIRAGLRGRRAVADDVNLGLRLRAEYVSGDEGGGFDYLTGWQADARMRLDGSVGALRWEADYEFEYNDRDDLAVGNDFFSVSPLRHEVGAEVGYPLLGRLRGTAEVEYRLSRYRDTEMRNGVDVGEREDDRLSAGVGLSHPIGTHWTGRIEADYLDNNSNFDTFDYERTEVLLSLGYSFR